MIKKDKKYLIFGATGFVGRLITKEVLLQGGKVIACSRNFEKYIDLLNFLDSDPNLKDSFRSNIEFYQVDLNKTLYVLGSSPKCSLFKELVGVFNCTGYQDNRNADKMITSCLLSNFNNTLKILEFFVSDTIEFIMGFSTVRAFEKNLPNTYISCKRLQEQLFCNFSEQFPKTKYCILRLGNILYSDFSITTKWRELIKKGKSITVTDFDASRFFMTEKQVIKEVYSALKQEKVIYNPKMNSASLKMLFLAISRKYKKDNEKIDVNFIGLQPNEQKYDYSYYGSSDDCLNKYKMSDLYRII